MLDADVTLAAGMELTLVPTDRGGRHDPVVTVPGKAWSYRPNWRLPGMTGTEQAGAPVLAFSRPVVHPGERALAVIIPIFPALIPRWRRDVVGGVVLPMYEGPRVCGHGRVLWVAETRLPLPDDDEACFVHWLESGATTVATDG
ncbi:hypothetical protein EV191_101776 [Tamaricihabitans halophyticus]|uniref:Uncharacterized protein n=1 Tax=Tamaricihabitans halophyticus TaxID=1262583 RepID=A0A4R2R4W6_9PSEU|nr:hypothetical protein [Tamaricihabitans halophyticus]TCP56829.1 hypothetical protein EV191_101776 [Tamaricihabitans halophyticus]